MGLQREMTRIEAHQKGRKKLVLSPPQIVYMLEALDIRERLISRLAIFEGMRPSEISAYSATIST
jgi:integrase